MIRLLRGTCRPWLWAASAAYAAVVALLTFCQPADKPAADQAAEAAKTAYAFANHDPAVEYVGAEACAPCHADIYHDFRQTGKGRAFGKPQPGTGPEQVGGAHSVVYDRYSDRYYRAFWRGQEFCIAEWQLGANGRDTTHYRVEKADYVIGSGNQTRSFLMARAGYFYEMPITWYSAKRIWDLSPGYEQGHNTGFARVVGQQCLNCHNSQNEFVPNSVNRFTSVGNGMSCESCHGPGAAHVRAMEQGRTTDTTRRADRTIVNPKRLPVTAQLDVCRQCHLEGVTVERAGRRLTDYRPGMRLADFADVFIPARPGSDQTHFGFASHAERLQLSACFRGSAGKLTCTTCHNPHKPLGPQPMAAYNAQCQTCHRPDACDATHAARAQAGNNCVTCHMARSGTTDIPHVSSRDHLIRRRLGQDAAPKPETPKEQLVVLRSFEVSDDSAADERAHAVAAMLYFEQHDPNPEYLKAVRRAAEQLDFDHRVKYAWLARDPAAAPPLSGLTPEKVANPYTAYYVGQLLRAQGQSVGPWLSRAVALAPANADLRYEQAADLADAGNRPAAAQAYRELLKLQPWHKRALLNLGFLEMTQGNYAEALRLTREAKRQDPTYALAWENEANIELQQGHVPEALRLLDELIRRFPKQADKYRSLKARVQAMARG